MKISKVSFHPHERGRRGGSVKRTPNASCVFEGPLHLVDLTSQIIALGSFGGVARDRERIARSIVIIGLTARRPRLVVLFSITRCQAASYSIKRFVVVVRVIRRSFECVGVQRIDDF